MQRQHLRDAAKFGAGLITGDLLFGLWIVSSGMLPFNFLGVTWTLRACLAWMAADVILIVFLVFYGWRITDRSRTSSERIFLRIAGTVFGLVGLLHLARIMFGLDFVIGVWDVPYWLNLVAALATLFLSYTSFHFSSGGKK